MIKRTCRELSKNQLQSLVSDRVMTVNRYLTQSIGETRKKE